MFLPQKDKEFVQVLAAVEPRHRESIPPEKEEICSLSVLVWRRLAKPDLSRRSPALGGTKADGRGLG